MNFNKLIQIRNGFNDNYGAQKITDKTIELSIERLTNDINELTNQNTDQTIMLDNMNDKMRTISSQIDIITVS